MRPPAPFAGQYVHWAHDLKVVCHEPGMVVHDAWRAYGLIVITVTDGSLSKGPMSLPFIDTGWDKYELTFSRRPEGGFNWRIHPTGK